MRGNGKRQLTLAGLLTAGEMSHVLSKDCRSTWETERCCLCVCLLSYFSLWKSVFSLVLPGSDTERFPQWMGFEASCFFCRWQSWKPRFFFSSSCFLIPGTEWCLDGSHELILFRSEPHSAAIVGQSISVRMALIWISYFIKLMVTLVY